MLETLQERLARVTKTLRGEGHLTEYHVETALREIRLALLEADVSVEVVTRFIDRVRERAVGREVLNSVTPAQMVTKIVSDELVTLLGGDTAELDFKGRPAVVMLVGLQGSGKTTTAAKMARWIKSSKGLFPLLVPADPDDPGAAQGAGVARMTKKHQKGVDEYVREILAGKFQKRRPPKRRR